MDNIEEVPVKEHWTKAYKVGSRLFMCQWLGGHAWKLIEILPPSGLCVRCKAWGTKDAKDVVRDYLEVESSREKNTPPR